MRTLTLAITSQFPAHTPATRIQSTASSVYKQLQAQTPVPVLELGIDFITETIRLASLIYSLSILSLTPFCSSRKMALLQDLYYNLTQVSLAQWKEIPGIFLWILLIAAPSSGNDAQGRFLKKKMAVAGMSIGLEDFNLATGHLRAFWKVQRWIAMENERIEEVAS